MKAAEVSQEARSYTYEDANAKQVGQGQRMFYRLRQVDLDGSFYYSSTIQLIDATGQGVSLKVYPNPAVNQCTISFDVPERSRSASLTILTLEGKTKYKEVVSPGMGQVRELETVDWTAGAYLVILTTGNGETQQTKIIVQ